MFDRIDYLRSANEMRDQNFLINNSFVPWFRYPEELGLYREPLFFRADYDEPWDAIHRGSSFKVALGGLNLLLATRHQCLGFELRKAAIIGLNEGYLVSSYGSSISEPESDLDLVVFDFTEAVKRSYLANSHWFNLDKGQRPDFIQSVCQASPLMLCAGYLTEIQNELMEHQLRTPVPVHLSGSLEEGLITNSMGLRFFSPLSHAADGLSGGPAFRVWESYSTRYFEPFGMVITGNKARLHLQSMHLVLKFIYQQIANGRFVSNNSGAETI